MVQREVPTLSPTSRRETMGWQEYESYRGRFTIQGANEQTSTTMTRQCVTMHYDCDRSIVWCYRLCPRKSTEHGHRAATPPLCDGDRSVTQCDGLRTGSSYSGTGSVQYNVTDAATCCCYIPDGGTGSVKHARLILGRVGRRTCIVSRASSLASRYAPGQMCRRTGQ